MILNICKRNHILISWHDSDQAWTAQCLFLYVASEHWSKKALSMTVKKNTANEGSALGCCFNLSFPWPIESVTPCIFSLCTVRWWTSSAHLKITCLYSVQSISNFACRAGADTQIERAAQHQAYFPDWHLPPCFAGGSEEEGGSGEVEASKGQGKKHGAWRHAPHSRFCFTRNC